ncbi:MAG: hypothetical protein ACXWAV_03270 [Chthoniobacterales bacterium]
MKTSSKSLRGYLFFLALALTFAFAGEVRAGFFFNTIAVDENGNGTFSAIPGPLAFSMAPDPGPGGLSSALTYNLGFGPVVIGDLLLTDPGSGTSDLIRFNLNPNGTASLVFYSIFGEGALADSGLPSARYTNLVTILENPSGPTTYVPTPGQPGYNAGLTYLISSFSPQAVPESGGTIFLLSGAVVGLLLVRRGIPI